MEQVIQVAVLCLLGALVTLLLKKGSPETALLLSLGIGVTVLLFLLQDAEEIVSFLGELMERTAVPQEVFLPLFKTIGIALVARTGSDLCRDAGESALASLVETAGSFCAVLVSLPLLRAVLSLLLELM